MFELHQKYLIDEKGEKQAVVLPYKVWQKVLEALEELEDIRLYDEAKRQPSHPIPLDEAIREIQEGSLE